MILKFRMLSDENDNFVRDFEVDPMMKLSEFHDFIIKSIGYDDCMASFFTADEEWQRCREFTLMDMGDTGYEGEKTYTFCVNPYVGETIGGNNQ